MAELSLLDTREGCGHLLKLEAPAKFNSVVRQIAVEHQSMWETPHLNSNFTTPAH